MLVKSDDQQLAGNIIRRCVCPVSLCLITVWCQIWEREPSLAFLQPAGKSCQHSPLSIAVYTTHSFRLIRHNFATIYFSSKLSVLKQNWNENECIWCNEKVCLCDWATAAGYLIDISQQSGNFWWDSSYSVPTQMFHQHNQENWLKPQISTKSFSSLLKNKFVN